jgi:hypothetical protein
MALRSLFFSFFFFVLAFLLISVGLDGKWMTILTFVDHATLVSVGTSLQLHTSSMNLVDYDDRFH